MSCTKSQSVDGDPSWWNEEDWLMAFDLGYDEGGSGDTLLVSVQVGIVEQARRFKRHWKKRLGDLAYFHSKDFRNFSGGVFTKAGLDRQEREDLLADLARLVHQHLTVGITTKISQSLYNENTSPDFRSQYGSAYSFCVNMLILAVYVHLGRSNLRSDINILVEDGHRNSAQAVLLLNKWKTAPPVKHLPNLRILTAGLGSKVDHPILQSADMLAYSKYQHVKNGDRVIYDALHAKGTRYERHAFEFNLDLIKEIQVGPREWMERRRDHWFTNKQNKP